MEYPVSWTCERITLKLEFYLLDRLSRGEALAVAEHVEVCAECAQLLVLLVPPMQSARDG